MGAAVQAVIVAGSFLTALTTLIVAGRGIWKFNRRIVHIADAVRELTPNGGSSLKDQVTAIDEKLGVLSERVDGLSGRVDTLAGRLERLTGRFDEHTRSERIGA